MNASFKHLSQRLAYTFTDPALLKRALTHRSKGPENNERLEFLGDSVLNVVIAAELFDLFPNLSEGELTRLRARLVKQESLARLARELELGEHLILGSGELKSGGFDRDSILADALEAVFGAVFEDGGFTSARSVILGRYKSLIDDISIDSTDKDAKTLLQEYLQKQSLAIPVYSIVEIEGEPHQQTFVVECSIPGLKRPVRGNGASRRVAEQDAAAKALEELASN